MSKWLFICKNPNDFLQICTTLTQKGKSVPSETFIILGVSGLFCRFNSIFLWKILSAYTVDPDQMPHDVASDLGLHCLPMILLRVFM